MLSLCSAALSVAIHLLENLQYDQSLVILRVDRPQKLRDVGHHGVTRLFGAQPVGPLGHRHQTAFAVLVPLLVHRLGDPVRIEER